MFYSPPGLRVLAATVNDDLALDGCSVLAKYTYFACATSEASTRIIDRLALCIGRCKRWLNPWRLK